MGKLKFFGLLLAAGMFAACSDNLENAGNENDGPKTGEGYVKVAINLPSVSSSRAFNDGTTGSLNDGTPDEYAVKDAILVFFKTTTATETPEATAEFVKAYNVTLGSSVDSENHVTNRHSVIGEAPMPAEGEQIYALAIVNSNGLFSINATKGELNIKTGTDTGTGTDTYVSVFETTKTLSALQDAIATTATECTATGFMMLNAPLATTNTPTNITDLTKVKTLVPVTVYESKNLAENGKVASIYVERVVAKVTLTGFTYANSKYTKDVDAADGDPFHGDEVELQGWTLNYTNKTFKPVRDVDAITTWLGNDYGVVSRFLGDSGVDGEALYRIYWAEDGNYDVDYDGTEGKDAKTAFNVFTKPDDIQIEDWNTNTADHKTDSEDYALYCLENTMNHDMQKTNQTTSLILKTKYLADPTSDEEGPQNFFMYGTQEATYTQTQFLANVGTALSLSDGITASLKDAAGGTYTYIPSGSKEGEGKYLNKKDVKNLITLSSGEFDNTKAQTLISKLGEIKFFKDGDSYYNVVLIRHFYDDETKWDGGGYTGAHLGRYGVVRNNWYEINVKSISGPGEPTIVDNTEEPTPDDEEEGYIKCQINVLSWAKRQQSVDL